MRASARSPRDATSADATRADASARSACVCTPPPSTIAGRSREPRQGSVNAMSHLQQMRIGAEPANGHLPRGCRWDLEDQIELDRHDEPCRFSELLIELAGAPPGVA